MPLDLHALVDDIIARKTREDLEDVAKATEKQKRNEPALNEQRLLLDYVREEAYSDPKLASTLDRLTAADTLVDCRKILDAKENSSSIVTEDDVSRARDDDLPSLLSLSPRRVLPTERELKDFQSKIIPRVARRIESDRDKVLQFVDPLSRSSSSSSSTPLCDAIQETLARLSTEESLLVEEEAKREKLLLDLTKTYEELYSSSLLLLNESLPITLQEQVLHLRLLQGKIKSLDLKAKVTHFSLTRQIYTPRSIKALKVVRYELDKKVTACEKQYSVWSAAARNFDAVEPEFHDLVKEFKSLLDQMETQKFILNDYGEE